ncbi:acyltransferase family protein [Aurantiacibacter poecillastricola]|uniref:acyltransferase family protein n=1 Tax=Aurantiacibacter poecillastricola TaxID=3064385 RepID=UPI00273EADB0|nr:acyltransferase [Aurantiacibacter sp. 219JJ12-13]MDP5260017.1 acyltransferase [Aurantiacibacter sp. 219JJ12-13]
MIAPVAKMNNQQLHSLDMLRGIAALMVAMYHCGWLMIATPLDIVRNAGLMVDFFFVLSGFVIAYCYDGRLGENGPIRAFMAKRFWRLWPLHLATMLAFIGIEVLRLGFEIQQGTQLSPPAFGEGYALAIIANILLLHSTGLFPSVPDINAVSWSISVEFYTYFIFALVSLTGRLRLAIFAALAFASAALLYIWHGRLTGEATTFGLLRCLYSFGLGFITFRLFSVLRPASQPRSGILYAVGLGLLLFLGGWFIGFAGKTIWEIVVPPLFALAVLALALAEKPGDFESPAFAPLKWLGKVSYSIYMVHLAINWFFVQFLRVVLDWPASGAYDGMEKLDGGALAGNLWFAAYLLAVLVVSGLTFHFIENRFRRGLRQSPPSREVAA